MRIVIVKNDSSVDHYTEDPDYQGQEIDTYDELPYGIRVVFPNGEGRLYPWDSIKFVDAFHTP